MDSDLPFAAEAILAVLGGWIIGQLLSIGIVISTWF